MRSAPSRRMTSPLSIGLSTMCATSAAYSSGRPSRLGCGTCAPRPLGRLGQSGHIGVRINPGAMVITRMALSARSRAALKVNDQRPPWWPRRPPGRPARRTPRRGGHTITPGRRPRARCRHGGRRQPEHIERADQVDLDHPAESSTAAPPACRPTDPGWRPRHSDGRAQDAEVAGRRHRPYDIVFVAHIPAHEAELLPRLEMVTRTRQVQHDRSSSGSDHGRHGGPAQTRGAAGHQDDIVVTEHHRCGPRSSCRAMTSRWI